MTTFWIAATALLVIALSMMLPALLGRARERAGTVRELNVAVYHERRAELRAALDAGDVDEQEHAAALRDLDLALLEDVPDEAEQPAMTSNGRGRWLAVLVGIALPVAGIGLYAELGTPEAIGARPSAAQRAAPAPGAGSPDAQALPSVEEMVARLEDRLASTPDDADGWLTLGRSYTVMKRYADAARAYERATALVGEVPDVLVDHAEALALSDERRLQGPAGEIAARALELAPDHPKALWLNGFAALQGGDPARAVTLWNRLVELLPADSAQRDVVVGLIGQAGGQAPLAPASEPAAAPGGAITVNVSLDGTLAGEAGATDTLYVFARAVDGPPMPVAIKRLSAGALPASIVLDDSLSMVPTAKLSRFAQVVIGARISRSGNPIAESGDLQGVSGIIDVRGQEGPVEVRIDQRLP